MRRFATILLLLAALPFSAVAATMRFIDARNGSNGFSGLAASSVPKRTIQAAVNAASGGGATKQGAGQPWTPVLAGKGGESV